MDCANDRRIKRTGGGKGIYAWILIKLEEEEEEGGGRDKTL